MNPAFVDRRPSLDFNAAELEARDMQLSERRAVAGRVEKKDRHVFAKHAER